MSTSFITEPKIKYKDFLVQVDLTKFELVSPGPEPVYCVPHCLIRNRETGDRLFIYENEEGDLEFERFNVMDIEGIFPLISEQFKCDFIDYCGLSWKLHYKGQDS